MATTTTTVPSEPAPAYNQIEQALPTEQQRTISKPDLMQNPSTQSYPQQYQVQNGQPAPVMHTMQPMDNPGMVVPLEQLQEYPEWVDCPYCGRRGKTRVEKSDSWMTFLAGFGCCLICICLAPLPCIAEWCQDIKHYCHNCNRGLVSLPYNGGRTVYPQIQPAGPNFDPRNPQAQQANMPQQPQQVQPAKH